MAGRKEPFGNLFVFNLSWLAPTAGIQGKMGEEKSEAGRETLRTFMVMDWGF